MRKKLLVSLFTILVFGGCGHELENGNSTDGDSSIPQITAWSFDGLNTPYPITLTVNQPVTFTGISAKDQHGCWCYWSTNHCGGTTYPPPSCSKATKNIVFPNTTVPMSTMKCILLDGTSGGMNPWDNNCTPNGPLTPDGMTWNPIYDENGNFKCWNLNNLIPDNC